MKKLICLFTILLITTGCAKLKHMRQLLTLKDMAEVGEATYAYVEAYDQNFESLAALVKSGEVEQYKNKEEIIAQFGEPIHERSEAKDGRVQNVLMYRYTTIFMGSDKVYLIFDSDNRLFDWEFIEGTNKEK